MSATKIEWTETTWNPLTGCTKVSSGCKNCYAEKMALRLQAMGSANYINGFNLTMHEHVLEMPFKWKKPRLIFVNSMSDLFHEDVPLVFIQKVFNVAKRNPQHTFQVLTKRSERLATLAPRLEWHPNIWVGVSVEAPQYKDRIDHLRKVPAALRFLSCEPLIADLGELNLDNIQWVIVGGESGIGARPIDKEWVISIREQCKTQSVPFFFKQWGGVNKKKTGHELDGKVWHSFPQKTEYCCIF
ncbi:DUF5131 family protein [Desulfovibrio litoralis]|uniref:Protein gp37 n=1 Tax=Desulfovibrio litoralis DSM 11393 TaxID=1121455 RepID=A0A1M7T7K5_9BACT|nr:phage Gp37/Gp68 family protein [Desulfovibrio litoralis]SHN66700.1 protein gp37 [Desulfovibrio litoralis DSM 11393]